MPAQKATQSDGSKFEKMREEANSAEMTSSPALKDDATTDSGGAGEQTLPEGNRFA
ncbi:MAG: hypothetical protein WBF53_08350 [Litorimonas sp.]